MLLFCAQIRSVAKVALSGECADEIFGGYPWYTDPQVREAQGFPWAQNTTFRINCLHPDVVSTVDAEDFVQSAYEDTVRSADILPGTVPVDRRMKEMTVLNFRWFMQTLLDRKDRMSMYNGLEVRVPFCDYRIAEYMYTVPWSMKHYRGMEKGLLRHSMRGIIPDDILWRKKSPYPKTFDPKYEQVVGKRLCQIKDDRTQPIHQIIAPECLQRIVDADYNWPWYGQIMRGPQTMAFMLQINDWMKTYNVRFV
jgi:asparagine synthase (glutamine-hydrolysing)